MDKRHNDDNDDRRSIHPDYEILHETITCLLYRTDYRQSLIIETRDQDYVADANKSGYPAAVSTKNLAYVRLKSMMRLTGEDEQIFILGNFHGDESIDWGLQEEL